MAYSTSERIAHVYRRLGMGAHPELVASTAGVTQAIERSLSLEDAPPTPFEMEPPLDRETATDVATLAPVVASWLTSMANNPRVIEERLVWFWHDHFATAIQKVQIPYLMHRQHLTIREHATGSFRDLLHAVAFDPAMLFYLDGARNHSAQINENFAREVMELHTMGPGNYTQTDITEAAKALTGWVVFVPYGRQADRITGVGPWESFYVPFRHYSGTTTILGATGRHTPSDVIDILLDQPQTAVFVAEQMWRELVGTEPSPGTVEQLAAAFRSEYSIMDLVAEIAWHPEFVSEQAVRAKIRTPVERLVAVAQGFGDGTLHEQLGYVLYSMAYLPFNPPSPAGYPKGNLVLGPHQLIHAFDFLHATSPDEYATVEELAARIGIFDLSTDTRRTIDSTGDQTVRTALVLNSPEFALV